jgi:hypothetical protein
MCKRKWSVRDKRTGKDAQLAEVEGHGAGEWAVVWTDAGKGSRFTAQEALVALAFATLFAERFGDKQAKGRFVAQEVK